jgi:ribonuclease P protein component
MKTKISPSQLTKFPRAEIQLLFKKAKSSLKHPLLDIRRAPASKEYARMLIVMPAKVGRAVDRNTIRRRLKAIFYEKELFKRGYDLLLFIKPGAATLTFEQLTELLSTATI